MAMTIVGLWNFLSMLEMLEHCLLDDLLAMHDELLLASPLLAELTVGL